MLPALAYRQALFVLDLLLIGLLAAVGFVAVKGMVLAESRIAAPTENEFVPEPIPQVGPLGSYEVIVASNLFGNPPAKPVDAPAPEPTNVIEETGLPLKLGGTVVAGVLSSAMVEDQSRRLSNVYYLNQEIIPKVTLVEVRKNAIVLDNGNTGQREILRREDAEESGPVLASASPSPRQPHPVVRQERHETVVDRAAVMAELQTNATTLYSQVRPEFKKDARGNTVGITSSNISSVPLAKEIGLKDNDVVTSINGEKIDSEEKLGLLLQKYGNAKTVRLGIERSGRPQVLNLRLE